MHNAVKMQFADILKQLEHDLVEVPDVREHKVAKLRFLIETGRYNVSSLAIAEAILEDHATMFGHGPDTSL